MSKKILDISIAIKGAGDLASGIASRLFSSNIRNLYLMEIEKPLAVRRLVSFSEAIYNKKMTVEKITAILAKSVGDIKEISKQGHIPIIIDPLWKTLKTTFPDVLIDAIMAKKNLGTNINDAKLVIGLGPGFTAGKDVDLVVETKRGHNLGKLLKYGTAQKNTSIPEKVNNFSTERVIKSPLSGLFIAKCQIGDIVKKGDIIGNINQQPIIAQINGILRGLLHSETKVIENMKIADIDPRGEKILCSSISDKARTLGGSVLEAILKTFLV